ncbi:MAG: hypothetical protein ACHRHE_16660 [Tepidisphaerales bacterium]
MDSSHSQVLQYATPKPNRGDAFASLFITLAILCTVVGAVSLLNDLAAMMLAFSVTRPGLLFWQGCMLASVDCLLLAGSVGTFRRQSWARRLVQVASAVQVLIALLALLPLLLNAGNVLRNFPWWLILVGVGAEMIRLAQGVLCLWAFGNMRADFWFGTVARAPSATLSGTATAKPALKRFKVHGIDRMTGQSIEYLSSAATADRAHRGAIALGLDHRSIEIQVIVSATESAPEDVETGDAAS